MTTIRLDIEQIRGDSFDYEFPQTDTTDATNTWFTLKDQRCKSDDDAIIQVDEITGLLIVNGVVASIPAQASIIRVGRVITVQIDASVIAQIPTRYPLIYDLQLLQGADIRTAYNGRWANVSDVTRTIETPAGIDAMLWPEFDVVLWPDGTAVLWP